MVFFILIILIMSNAPYSIGDKSILYNRIIILYLLLGNIILINNIISIPLHLSIDIHNGIFIVTWYRLLLYFMVSNIYIYIFYTKINNSNMRLLIKFTSRYIYKSFNLTYFISFLPKLHFVITFFLPFSHYYEIRSHMLPYSEMLDLNEDLRSSLNDMLNMVQKLESLKRTEGIRYIVDNQGNMSLDVPNSVSDAKAEDLSKRVGIIDRLYNTQWDKYKKLVNKDETSNDKMLSSNFNKHYQDILSRHKSLFESDN